MSHAKATAKRAAPKAAPKAAAKQATKAAMISAAEAAAALDPLYEAALAAGLVYAEDGETLLYNRWYSPVLRADWTAPRKGNNNTTRVRVQFQVNGAWVDLNVRVFGQKHIGRIDPLLEEDVAKENARIRNKDFTVSKRTKGVALQVYEYDVAVKTAEDGFTVLEAPPAEARSDYFRFANYLDIFLQTEIHLEFASGRLLKTAPRGKPLPPGSILVSIDKVVAVVQRYISPSAKKNAGMPLPNPITRITLKFDKDTFLPDQLKIFDRSKPYTDANGARRFEEAKVGETPVTAVNVHEFVRSNAEFDGIFCADNICFSNLGISMPIYAPIVVMSPPVLREADLDDLYDDAPAAASVSEGAGGSGDAEDGEGGDGDEDGEYEQPGEPEVPLAPPAKAAPKAAAPKAAAPKAAAPKAAAAKAAAPKAARPKAAAPKAPEDTDDLDALVDGLSAV